MSPVAKSNYRTQPVVGAVYLFRLPRILCHNPHYNTIHCGDCVSLPSHLPSTFAFEVLVYSSLRGVPVFVLYSSADIGLITGRPLDLTTKINSEINK